MCVPWSLCYATYVVTRKAWKNLARVQAHDCHVSTSYTGNSSIREISTVLLNVNYHTPYSGIRWPLQWLLILFWFFISFVYLVDLIAVAAQSRYNLWFRNATLLVSANARWLHLVTKPSSQLLRNCGTVFWRRSETFRPSHLLNKLSKHTLLRQLFIDLFIYSFSR